MANYVRTRWENAPSELTPVAAELLNHAEQGITDNCEDIEALKARIEALEREVIEPYTKMRDAGSVVV